MKAQLLTGIRQMEMCLLPDPVIEKDDDVLLKVETVGLCGSDVHYYETGRIGSQVVQFASGGFILGHEFVATVIRVGAAVTKLCASDTVVVDPAVVCHHCDQYLCDRENTTLQQSEASSDSAIAILGSGPIGLSCLAAAKITGIT